MRNACKSTTVFLVELFPNLNSKNRSQQNRWHMYMHDAFVCDFNYCATRAPRFFSRLEPISLSALANNRLSATLAFLPRKTSFLWRTCSRVEISKGQVSGAATADLSYKVLQPIQRLNATRNSIHMHYVQFSCSLVVCGGAYLFHFCVRCTLSVHNVQSNLSLAAVCFHHA
jgi:hypothetical protein